MSIRNEYKVLQVPNWHTYEWILKKHYAHRTPSISYAFMLYQSKLAQGVCTFGYPPNYEFNNGACVFNDYKVTTLELNRLVVNDGLKPNTLSFFVSQALHLLPKPLCIVSYSDPNHGHHGYIYQSTNWIYSGTSTPKEQYTFESGEVYDIRRGIDKKGKIVKTETLLPTHRYFMFLGNKQQRKEMRAKFKYPILPYPKGDNTRYDAGYTPPTQGVLV